MSKAALEIDRLGSDDKPHYVTDAGMLRTRWDRAIWGELVREDYMPAIQLTRSGRVCQTRLKLGTIAEAATEHSFHYAPKMIPKQFLIYALSFNKNIYIILI